MAADNVPCSPVISMRRTLGLSLMIGFIAIESGCMAYGYPYTRDDLARDSVRNPGPALVHYLSQPNADPSACTPASPPSVAMVDASVADRVARSIEDGGTGPERGEKCLALLLGALDVASCDTALARIADVYVRVLHRTPETPAVALALHRTLVFSEAATAHPSALDGVARRLGDDLAAARLTGPMAALAAEAMTAREASVGRWHGADVTADVLGATDDASLAVLAVRLPTDDGRRLASAERVRRLARASSFAETRADVEGTVARVLATGWNVVDLAARPVRKVWFDSHGPYVQMLVRQDVAAGVGTLLARAASGVDVLPSLTLTGWLHVEVGLSRPVTICPPGRLITADPCIATATLTVDSPFVRIVDEGTLALSEHVPLASTVAWLDDGDFTAVMHLGRAAPHRPAAATEVTLRLPVVFEEPPTLRFVASGMGEPGPNLSVTLTERGGAGVIEVQSAGGRHTMVVPLDGHYGPAVTSEGGPGARGFPGMNGMAGASGFDGMAATCYSPGGSGSMGGNGTDGTSGGPGGPGGPGGDANLTVTCGEVVDCQTLVAAAARLVVSIGGPGGPGGSGGQGGRGGDGGRGGSSNSCTTYVNGHPQTHYQSGGIRGSRGRDGMNGAPGWTGTNGEPGVVRIDAPRRARTRPPP